MSNYPIWWDTTITLYNRYEDPVTNQVVWYRTVLAQCFVKNQNNLIHIGNDVVETNQVIVRIPQNRKYQPCIEWLQNPQEGFFTLHQGDIIVIGRVNDTIDEYTNGQRSTDLMAKYTTYGKCLVVTKYQENIGESRVYPHYRAECSEGYQYNK